MSNFVPQTRKFDHYDPIFENKYEKVAPEFGELHQSIHKLTNSRKN